MLKSIIVEKEVEIHLLQRDLKILRSVKEFAERPNFELEETKLEQLKLKIETIKNDELKWAVDTLIQKSHFE